MHMTCLLLAQDTQVKIVCVSDLLVIIVQSLPTHVLKCFLCRCLGGGGKAVNKGVFCFRKGDHSGCM